MKSKLLSHRDKFLTTVGRERRESTLAPFVNPGTATAFFLHPAVIQRARIFLRACITVLKRDPKIHALVMPHFRLLS